MLELVSTPLRDGSGDAVIDRTAAEHYRRRLAELSAEREDATTGASADARHDTAEHESAAVAVAEVAVAEEAMLTPLRILILALCALAVIGAVAGVLVAASGTRVLGALLHGVTPLDVATFGGALALVLTLALAAASLPARAAGRVDPVEALRAE